MLEQDPMYLCENPIPNADRPHYFLWSNNSFRLLGPTDKPGPNSQDGGWLSPSGYPKFVNCPPGASVIGGSMTGPDMKDYSSVICDDPVRNQKISWISTSTISGYSNEVLPLPPTQDINDILNEHTKHFQESYGTSTITDNVYQDMIKANYKEFGSLATRYLPQSNIIKDIDDDIDHDGIKEKLLTISSLEGNHCCDTVQVIRGDSIVFSFSGSYPLIGIKSAESNDGFYISWASDEQYLDGLCCSTGYIQTQFKNRQDAGFVPIRERTETYVTLP